MEHKMEKEEERGGKGEILFDWNLWAKGITCILTKLSHVPLLCSSLAALITHEHFMYYMIACTHKHTRSNIMNFNIVYLFILLL